MHIVFSLSPDLLPPKVAAIAVDYSGLIIVAVAAAAVLLYVIGISVHLRDLPGGLGSSFLVLVIAACALTLASGLANSEAGSRHDSLQRAATSQHTTQVREWLEGTYGIQVSKTDTARLISGGDLGVNFQGSDELIELKPAAQGKIAVYSVGNRTLLIPKSER